MKNGYIVIYDYAKPRGEDVESYYGFFDTAEEAERMYKEMIGDDGRYHSAHVCQIVKEI